MEKNQPVNYLNGKQALLLDMNSTFMFGEDRFGDSQDYSIFYRELGGQLSRREVTELIEKTYHFLDYRYSLKEYHDKFPSLAMAFEKATSHDLPDIEIGYLTSTFAYHEKGNISAETIEVLQQLSNQFRLGLVIDIWSPKIFWLEYFKALDILNLFEAISFSSDHGHVKPSPYGFIQTLNTMKIDAQKVIFIGDSVRRDLGGARAAGLDCILVGEASDEQALDSFPSLLDLYTAWGL